MNFDGHGIYEAISPDQGQSVWGPRLQQIVNGGFSLVLNYDLLSATAANMVAYINYAASLGLKIIVAIHDPSIWKTATYATFYPEMYASAGNPATGIAFMQYVVGQVKGLSGVWGYYVGDEVQNADHPTLKTYTDAVKAADNSHPRLIVESVLTPANACYNSNSTQFDCCDVMGDDYYPIGDTQITWPSIDTVTTGIQSFCNANGLQSTVVLQAQSWQQYYPPARCNPWPSCAPWPTYSQMRAVRTSAVTNMMPRLILWYSFFDVLNSDVPGSHWSDLATAANGQRTAAPSFMMHS